MATCEDGVRRYHGHVWHALSVKDPTPETEHYMCINEGCPDRGSNETMHCKLGYHGPLCGICDRGYYRKLNRFCEMCEEPDYLAIAGLSVLFLAIVPVTLHKLWKYRDILQGSNFFSHGKILISFATIATTLDSQFGIIWPEEFDRLLIALNALAFDLQILSSVFCEYSFSFWYSLGVSTIALTSIIVGIPIAFWLLGRKSSDALAFSAYAGIFAFPVMSVKLAEVWMCHVVEGVSYLRADYNIECGTALWDGMATYTGFFIFSYVIAFPVFMFTYLFKMRGLIVGKQQVDESRVHLGFLCHDYRLADVTYMWEATEMARKLLLSCVGAFWSSKSVMCVGTALLINTTFHLLHAHYKPYRVMSSNMLQHTCMSVLSLLYFIGIMLKVDIDSGEQTALGYFMVTLVLSIFFLVIFMTIYEVRETYRHIKEMLDFSTHLASLPREDPEDHTEEFYAVQNPIDPAVIKSDKPFKPQQPHKLKHIDAMTKISVLQTLTKENEQLLKDFFTQVDKDGTIMLRLVSTPRDVLENGCICLKYNRKTVESIMQKSVRPAILAKNPSYSVEHVRDSFRFKAVVYSFSDALAFVRAIDRYLFLGGVSKESVVKLDIMKLREPKEWGWRFLAFDFRMPNGQLVENYIVFADMEHVKKNLDKTATVCKGLGNHEIFEKWRVKDVTQLNDEEREEYEADLAESNRRYHFAFVKVQNRTRRSEHKAFWKAFNVDWQPEFEHDEHAHGAQKVLQAAKHFYARHHTRGASSADKLTDMQVNPMMKDLGATRTVMSNSFFGSKHHVETRKARARTSMDIDLGEGTRLSENQSSTSGGARKPSTFGGLNPMQASSTFGGLNPVQASSTFGGPNPMLDNPIYASDNPIYALARGKGAVTRRPKDAPSTKEAML
jgi:hypothetical protein